MKIVLGTKMATKKRKNKKQIVTVEDAYYYIPLLKTLETQLNEPGFLAALFDPDTQRQENVLKDFMDGAFVHEHPLFGWDDFALKIIMYYDDVNVVNPQNNKAHQLGFFYYIVAIFLSISAQG